MSVKAPCLALLLCLLGAVSGDASWLKFLQLPPHDGVSRVCQIGETRISDLLTSQAAATTTRVVIVDSEEKQCSQINNFAEVVAQLLEQDQVKVCILKIKNLNILTNSTVFKGLGIHVFINGAVYHYPGKREVVPFLSYLKKLRHTEVRVITGRMDKVAFDAVQRPRVVGFFVNGTVDHQAFLEAARIFRPADIPFYTVHDRAVAKRMKLEIVGQINIHKPLVKTPVSCTVNPASVADIAVFVNSNKGTGFFHLTQNNFEQAKYDFEMSGEVTPVVLAVGDRSTPDGSYFYKLLLKVVKNSTDLLDGKLKVVWVDPEEFPVINVVENLLSKQYGLPKDLPAMGVLDETLNKTAWLSFLQLNITTDKQADEQNIRLMKQFLEVVSTGTSNFEPIVSGSEFLIRSPKSQTVLSGSTFDLDCIVHNVLGDCLWLRNGKHIGYNLDRFPHYSWAGNVNKGDCSLRVIGALEGRDDGSWVCRVTGDITKPDVTSAPAEIVIEKSAVPVTKSVPLKSEL